MGADASNASEAGPGEARDGPPFFASRAHAKALAYLHYGVKRGDGAVVLFGPAGAGKTACLRRLASQIDSERVALRTLDGRALDAASAAARLDAAFAPGGGRRVVVAIDDADAASIAALAGVGDRLAGSSSAALLLGRPILAEALSGAPLAGLARRVVARHGLGPLDEDEVVRFTASALGVSAETIAPDARRRLRLATRGAPGPIVAACLAARRTTQNGSLGDDASRARTLLASLFDELPTLAATEVDRMGGEERENGAGEPFASVFDRLRARRASPAAAATIETPDGPGGATIEDVAKAIEAERGRLHEAPSVRDGVDFDDEALAGDPLANGDPARMIEEARAAGETAGAAAFHADRAAALALEAPAEADGEAPPIVSEPASANDENAATPRDEAARALVAAQADLEAARAGAARLAERIEALEARRRAHDAALLEGLSRIESALERLRDGFED